MMYQCAMCNKMFRVTYHDAQPVQRARGIPAEPAYCDPDECECGLAVDVDEVAAELDSELDAEIDRKIDEAIERKHGSSL